MKTIKNPLAAVAALIASIVAAFGQYTVLVDDSSNIIFPTNLASIPAAGLTGTAPTNVLPGALATLSTWNGGGLLTNAAFPSVHWFTNQGTTTNWVIPTGAKSLRILAVANGGGGGSGKRGGIGTVCSGGGGGGGGNFAMVDVESVSSLWTNSLLFSIAPIRTGGASVTTDESNGTNGTAFSYNYAYVGAAANSNVLIAVAHGGPGLGGDLDGAGGGSSGVGFTTASAGGASSASGGAGAVGNNVTVGLAGAGGGAGGGIATSGSPSAGGNGGGALPAMFTIAASGGVVGASGSSYTADWPTISVVNFHGWPGAGGGGSSTNSGGGNGANGYWFGSGGGGGGASLNGFPSGKGGDGGPGAFMVICYWTCPAISFSDWIGAIAQWTYDTVSFLRHLAIPEIEFNSNEVTQ